jgi:MSHA pilin protein MshC
MFNVPRSTFSVQCSKFKVQSYRFKVWNLELETRNLKLETGNPGPGTRNNVKPRAGTVSAGGFTLVELVVTLIIIGLLAAVIGPRFIGNDAFASRGFFDEAHSVVRYAQKTAIAWRRPVFVCVTATTVSAGTVSGCGSLVVHPATGDPLTTTAPSGVTLTSASFSFDGGGRPNPNAQTTIAFTSGIAGDPARQIVVEAGTGYVHP